MEGITGYPFRNVHSKMFPGTDKYYIPFLSVHQSVTLTAREKKEIDPNNNSSVYCVPQLLGNDPGYTTVYINYIKSLGYPEVNINMGCPSRTVTSKHKGAGMLEDPYFLDLFLRELFNSKAPSGIKVSVKTRIGMYNKDEIEDIINIFNKYPLSEVIVHPRLGKDRYNGTPDMEAFDKFYNSLVHPVSYNGDLISVYGIKNIIDKYPKLNAIMIGRGLLRDPNLINMVKNNTSLKLSDLSDFHDNLLNAWIAYMDSSDLAILRMKELWDYLGSSFENSERYVRTIKKVRDFDEYKSAVYSLMHHCKFLL